MGTALWKAGDRGQENDGAQCHYSGCANRRSCRAASCQCRRGLPHIGQEQGVRVRARMPTWRAAAASGTL
jgi:hypothetical protein